MMKKILVLLIPFFAGFFQAPLVIGGEIIKGKACYRFSDQESIAAARDIALAMAKREALEGYSVFVNATTTVENYTMKNNLITSITAANLNNLKITKKSENLAKREVCRAIQAEVDPIEIKEQVAKRVVLPNISSGSKIINFPTGLWENKNVKWLKVIQVNKCRKYDGTWWKEGRCLKIRYLCKKEFRLNNEKDGGRIGRLTCTDDDDIPTLFEKIVEVPRSCFLDKGKIKEYVLFNEPKVLCNFYKAVEGSTKILFEWLD